MYTDRADDDVEIGSPKIDCTLLHNQQAVTDGPVLRRLRCAHLIMRCIDILVARSLMQNDIGTRRRKSKQNRLDGFSSQGL